VAEPHFIGSTQVSALGLGGASWSFADYAPWVAATPHPVDDDMAIQTIHAAPDSGLTLIDTARVSAQALAQRKGISVYRLALAWLLSQSPTLIPPVARAGRSPFGIRRSPFRRLSQKTISQPSTSLKRPDTFTANGGRDRLVAFSNHFSLGEMVTPTWPGCLAMTKADMSGLAEGGIQAPASRRATSPAGRLRAGQAR
jgi:hypothetical protein